MTFKLSSNDLQMTFKWHSSNPMTETNKTYNWIHTYIATECYSQYVTTPTFKTQFACRLQKSETAYVVLTGTVHRMLYCCHLCLFLWIPFHQKQTTLNQDQDTSKYHDFCLEFMNHNNTSLQICCLNIQESYESEKHYDIKTINCKHYFVKYFKGTLERLM